MKRLYIYILSSVWCCSVWSQTTAPDTTIIASQKLIRPSIYADYGKLITRLVGYEDKLEGAFSLLFLERYELIAEIGTATLSPAESYTNGNYSAEGTYYRFGGGYLGTFKSNFAIGLSARYGVSKFSDQGFIEIEGGSGIDNSYDRIIDRPDLEARWWELVVTSEKKLRFNKDNLSAWYNELFAIGFNIRMRFLVTYTKESPIDVYSIPGYGKTIDKSTPAVNLFVKLYLF
ncbi:MAG: DUF6048 family protein [Cyclobacteriaceae bacterium]